MSKALSASVTFEALVTRVATLEGSPTFVGAITAPSAIITGGMTVGGPLKVGDVNFLLQINGGNPQISLDTGGDTFTYNRATNTYAFAIGGALAFSIGPGSIMIPLSQLTTYADNAAATTGGLGVGGLYRTATGQLMVRY